MSSHWSVRKSVGPYVSPLVKASVCLSVTNFYSHCLHCLCIFFSNPAMTPSAAYSVCNVPDERDYPPCVRRSIGLLVGPSVPPVTTLPPWSAITADISQVLIPICFADFILQSRNDSAPDFIGYTLVISVFQAHIKMRFLSLCDPGLYFHCSLKDFS